MFYEIKCDNQSRFWKLYSVYVTMHSAQMLDGLASHGSRGSQVKAGDPFPTLPSGCLIESYIPLWMSKAAKMENDHVSLIFENLS